MFFIGQRVECIDASPARYIFPTFDVLKLGRIYTIIECEWYINDDINGFAVKILEVILPNTYFGSEGWWDALRFRPIDKKKTDISIFEKILKEERNNTPGYVMAARMALKK